MVISQTTNKPCTNDAFLNPFAIASYAVFSMIFGEVPVKGPITTLKERCADYQVVVSVGVTGDLRGHCLFGMSTESALGIASAMVDSTVQSFDELAQSALGELANMICGNGLLQVSNGVGSCDITPPALVSGVASYVSTLSISPVVMPLTLSFGCIDLIIGLVAKEDGQ